MRSVATRRWVVLLLMLALAGCASAPRATSPSIQPADAWAGRISLRVDADQPGSFTAAFDLKGNADTGQLSLYAPFGATIAHMLWSPGDARLQTNGTERSFSSLEQLAKQATGADIPIGSLFKWLKGEAANAQGWQADLSELSNGRLVARRSSPAPALELRLVLEQ